VVSEPRDADSVAARLRVLRGNLGLSQEQLARRLGVSFATVNRWESGRTQPSARASQAVAELEADSAARSAADHHAGPGPADSAGAATPRAATAADNGLAPETFATPGDGRRQAPAADGGGTPADSPGDSPRLSQLRLAQTRFIGRQRELVELADLISQSRLVSLVGPGGAGKTRLALEVIENSFASANVVFLQLESVRLPRALAPALASRLGVHDQPGVEMIQSLRTALAQTPRLLVLDGAEALREEAGALVSDLLGSAPGLRIVVTSRVLLGVPGEVCWTVPPLACPSVAAGAAEIAASDAVQLFIARASDRLPAFQAADVAPHAVAELCRRLDGLPLAIELIASWVGTLSIQEILQQRAVLLDSGPATGQAGGRRLADVLQVSYDLLDSRSQQLLPMLSIFASSFSLSDAQAVLDVTAPEAAVTIRALVDSSWLVVSRSAEQNQFSMLETIRSFAGTRLEQAGDGPGARGRHARHFADLAIESEHGLTGPDGGAWTSRLEIAEPDLQLALHWTEENGDFDLGLDAAGALWRWWLITGRLALGRGWLARLLRAAGPRQDERAGRAMCAAAVLAAENGDYHQAVRHAELALAVFESLGLTERMAFASTVLASAHRYLGDNAAARRSFQAAMDLRIALGDRRGVAVAINNMALLELDDGDLERAQELFERALAIKRELGERRSIAIGLVNLADVLIRRSQWDAADRVLTEAAGLAAGIPQIVGTIRCNQGNTAAQRSDWATATDHFQAAIAASQAAGHPHDVIEAMIGLAMVQHRSGRSEEGLRQLQAAEELAVRIGNPQRLAQVQAALAELAATRRYPALPGDLTARQAEVLGLLAAGLSNKEIAAELFLSLATVERHLATIYRKLGLSSRVEAARFALDNGLASTSAVSRSGPAIAPPLKL
jgi:predicted ATPase/DNA-binding NarL/FixJ family response regulator/transcriptional regulator with XRE-family HTH domain